MIKDNALQCVSTVLKYDVLQGRLKTLLHRQDLSGIVLLAQELGYQTDAYHLALALELQILRLLHKGQLTSTQVEALFGVQNWARLLHDWQVVHRVAATG